MAAFCTKCGASLPSGTGFCSSCGAPVVAAAAPPQPITPAPPAYVQQAAPAYPPPGASAPPVGYPPQAGYPAQPQKSSSTLKIVLIVIAVIVGLAVLAGAGVAFTAWRVARAIHLNNDGNGVTVSVPGAGTISAGDSTATDADLGVPAYPGAVREKGGMNLNSATVSMVMAHFTTTDSPSQVLDFYKGKMGEGTVAVSTGNGTVLNSGGKDTDRIMVTIGAGNGDDAGKTTIVIMHTKKSD